jgi:hypothetical protein
MNVEQLDAAFNNSTGVRWSGKDAIMQDACGLPKARQYPPMLTQKEYVDALEKASQPVRVNS